MAEPSRSEVSVVIPTRDRADRLGRTLVSVLAQQGVELEVIVVHDGPDRGGLEPARRLGDPRVRSLATDHAAGMAATRDAGLRHAGGRWVAFIDDDDLWSPTKLRDQLATAGSSADFAYSAVVNIDDRDRIIAEFPAPSASGLHEASLAQNVIPAGSSNVTARRSALLALGGWDDRFVHFADWDMWIRLAAAGTPAAVSTVAVAYVQHMSAMSLSPAAELFREFRLLNAKHAASAAEQGVVPNETAFIRFVAERQRRAGRSREAAKLYLSAAWRSRRPRDFVLAGHAASRVPVPKRRRPATADWIRRRDGKPDG